MKPMVRLLVIFGVILSGCSAGGYFAQHIGRPPAATALSTSPTAKVKPPSPMQPSAVTSPARVSPTVDLTAATVTPMTLPTSVSDLPPAPTATQPGAATATPAPSATAGPSPAPASDFLDQYLPQRVKVAETEHFIFYAQDNYAPIDMQWWTAQAETVYAYVSQRMQGAQVKRKISLAFIPPETRSCPVRGLASNDNGLTVLVYADKHSTHPYLLSVLAHEIGHAISYDFPEGLPGSISLAEGLATWAAGKYWAEWKQVPSLDALTLIYLQAGEYESISSNYDLHGVYPWQKDTGTSEECIARRDRVYSEWGAFTGYLIDSYGWVNLHQLYQTRTEQRDGKLITYPPDYVGVYGKALNQLELDWLQKVEAIQ